MLNDGPERKKFIRSLPRFAVPVNVTLSATADPPRKPNIARERAADLNDSPIMEPPVRTGVTFGDFRHISKGKSIHTTMYGYVKSQYGYV
jgi:hypothetical protein